MRPFSLITALFLAALFAFAAGTCRAEETSPADGDQPDASDSDDKSDDGEKEDEAEKKPITIPAFSIETLLPKEDGLLEKWEVLEDDPAEGHPSAEAVMEVAEANGLDEDTAYAEHRVVKTPAGAKAGIVMMDIDADPAAFRTALDAKATEAGWTVTELAKPNRLLIVGGEPAVRDEVRAEIVAHVVYEFAAMARKRLNIQTWDKSVKEGARAAAKGFIMAGRKLSPEAGALYAIESFFDLRTYMQKRGEAHANKEKQKKENDEKKEEEFRQKHLKAKKASEEALGVLLPKVRKALDPNIPLPPKGTLIVSLAGQVGGQLLERKEDKHVPEAVKMLEIAVAGDPLTFQAGYGNRYNLACGYARQNEIDKAFEWLRKSLEIGTLLTWQVYGKAFIHMEKKDEDMKPLRRDGRWEPLIREYNNDKVKKYIDAEKKREERKKKEEARRKK